MIHLLLFLALTANCEVELGQEFPTIPWYTSEHVSCAGEAFANMAEMGNEVYAYIRETQDVYVWRIGEVARTGDGLVRIDSLGVEAYVTRGECYRLGPLIPCDGRPMAWDDFKVEFPRGPKWPVYVAEER